MLAGLVMVTTLVVRGVRRVEEMKEVVWMVLRLEEDIVAS